MNIYKSIIRPLLFSLDPENAHKLTLRILRVIKPAYPIFNSVYSPSRSETLTIGSLTFRNRLGLAAGFDKNGEAIEFWDTIGFSHVEIGTVTPKPQPGNDRPRIFRVPSDLAIINRLGFNNKGADEVRENILKAKERVSRDFIIGVNIGKNKSTPVEDAVSDYVKCFEKMFDAADYFTVNVSSPNTPGLRQLQDEDHLAELLSKIAALNNSISSQRQLRNKDIFLKIAPDINDETVHSIFNICNANEITGIIATNTTIERSGLQTVIDQQGGLSGKPLFGKSNEVLGKLNELRKASSHKTPALIGVGGVFTKSDYEEKIRLGASLVQVYTGFVYEGPAIIREFLDS